MTSLAQDAHDYAARGLAVFPLQPREKKPYGFTTGLHAASDDVATVAGWWAERGSLPLRAPRRPDERLPARVIPRAASNIGLATGARSGCWVLDIDGEAGITSLLHLASRYGRLPITVRQDTGKGGHLFFKWPGELPWGGEIRPSASKFAEGLDVRGQGGYVVLPPSIHPSGRAYRWVDGCNPYEMGFAVAPMWLLRLVAPPPPPKVQQRSLLHHEPSARAGGNGYALGALDAARAEIASSPQGQHNVTLHRNAYGVGRLVAAGELDREKARQALIAAAAMMVSGDPRNPWTEQRAAFHVDNAFKRAEADPRHAPAPNRVSR